MLLFQFLILFKGTVVMCLCILFPYLLLDGALCPCLLIKYEPACSLYSKQTDWLFNFIKISCRCLEHSEVNTICLIVISLEKQFECIFFISSHSIKECLIEALVISLTGILVSFWSIYRALYYSWSTLIFSFVDYTSMALH